MHPPDLEGAERVGRAPVDPGDVGGLGAEDGQELELLVRLAARHRRGDEEADLPEQLVGRALES